MSATNGLAQINATNRAIAYIVEAANKLALATQRETALEDLRPAKKQAAILRLMATENPLTSTSDKPKLHSASSAEAVVEMDAEYAQHRSQQSAAVIARITAWGEYEAAVLRAKMENTLLEKDGAAARGPLQVELVQRDEVGKLDGIGTYNPLRVMGGSL